MKTKKILGAAAVLLVLGMGSAQAQVGMPTNTPQKNAQLDLNAANNTNTKGLLLPRVALVATDNVAPLTGTVLSGMKVYNIATAGTGETAVSPGEYYYDGAKWVRVGVDAPEPWYNAATKTAATSNTQSVYQMGYVGIGTDNPLFGLDVAQGHARIGTAATGGGRLVIQNYDTSGEEGGRLVLQPGTPGDYVGVISQSGKGATANLTIANTGGFIQLMSQSGKVGIGNSNPRAYLDVIKDALIFDVTVGRGGGEIANNTVVGNKALAANTTGYFNTAVGAGALTKNTTGYSNTAIGSSALYSNTNGLYNVAVGTNALSSNTTGKSNSAFGNATLQANLGSSNSAFGDAALYNNTTGSKNTAFGSDAFKNVTTGNDNVGVGYLAGPSVTTGSNNICIGTGADISNGNNQIRIGNTAISYAGIQVAWTVTSDARLKTNVENNPLGLDFVKQLRPVVYNRYANEGNGVNSKNEYGFIAQEVKGTLEKNNMTLDKTGLVSYDESSDRYSVRYNDLISILTKAIQDQQKLIENQQKQIDALSNDVKLLKAK